MGLGSQASTPIYEAGVYPFYFPFRYDDLTEVLLSQLMFCVDIGLEEWSKTTKGEDTTVVFEKGFEVVSS